MKTSENSTRVGWYWSIGAMAFVLCGYSTRSVWWQPTQDLVRNVIHGNREEMPIDEHSHDHDDPHAGHDHGADDSAVLELSKQAQANIGLSAEFLKPLKLETFRRTITVPAIIVDRPGRTRLEISTPMAGVITHVHAVQAEAVRPGTLLFQLRITAEELVSTQTDLLKTIGELDVENREIARLSKATETGAISQKTILERQYAKEKLEVLLSTQKEALRLHGLSERQIEEITVNRHLLRDLNIVAPDRDNHDSDELHLSSTDFRTISMSRPAPGDEDAGSIAPEQSASHDQNENTDQPHQGVDVPLILQEVLVHKGETVAAGATLAVLADYSELYIEGRAFEQDVDLMANSDQKNRKIEALFDGAGGTVRRVENLDLVYSASEIDVEARSLSFFVRLPNEVAREMPSPNGQRFLDWRYRPGQRLQLRVPIEEWTDQIVLPVEAIAREGAESFVFQQNGSHFDRVAVHVLYRDSTHAVLASDGSLFPGDVVALRGAHQLQMALKNKSGGGVDPHAGHNH